MSAVVVVGGPHRGGRPALPAGLQCHRSAPRHVRPRRSGYVPGLTAVAMFRLLPVRRHLVHLALGRRRRHGAVRDGQRRGGTPTGPPDHAPAACRARVVLDRLVPAAVAVQSAITVVLFCLAAVSLLAVTPATSTGAGRRARWAIWLAVGAAIICWGFAVPALSRAAGLDFPHGLLAGSPDAVRSALAVMLTPVAGSQATALAGWLLFATCLAGALGALTAGTGLAQSALARGGAQGPGQHGSRQNGPGQHGPGQNGPAIR